MSKLPATIGDSYLLLPISMPPTQSYPTPATHIIYLRPHEPKVPTQADSRSIFLVNVPADSTTTHFRAIFTTLIGAGRFESISFEHNKTKVPSTTTTSQLATKKEAGRKRKRSLGVNEKVQMTEEETELPHVWDRKLRRSGSTAVVVLVDEKSVSSVLKAVRKLHKSEKGITDAGRFPIWGDGVEGKVPPLGSARYATHQKMRYPDPVALRQSVDAFMALWNKREEEEARLAKRQRSVPDEDGFVTVTRGGRTGPARKEDAEEKRREIEAKDSKKRAEMSDFYRFQLRERRKLEQGELVKAFEEDKKRVEIMKEKRGRFRPEK